MNACRLQQLFERERNIREEALSLIINKRNEPDYKTKVAALLEEWDALVELKGMLKDLMSKPIEVNNNEKA